jgi:hypothetical protein
MLDIYKNPFQNENFPNRMSIYDSSERIWKVIEDR